MKQLILIGLLLGGMMPGLRAEGPPSPPRPSEAKEEPKEEPRLSNGERIEIPDVGFSIIPPNGWMVHKNAHGSSLLFEAPKQPNQVYQPTLQVMAFSQLRYIDEVTMKEYGDLIVEKFSKMSNRVTGYRLRDAAIQRLETGDPSILYYTEFQYDDVPIMQMHILVSSATNHFVMTYTDIAKVFEDESSPGLAIAYTSMHSAQLATRPPWRWRGFAIGGAAGLLLIVAWLTLRFLRARRLARLGQRIEEEDNKEITADEESQYYSRHTPATQAESDVGDEWASAKRQPKSASSKMSQVHSSHFDDDDEPEVSEVVPLSTLEKSLPGRKRRQEASEAAAAARHQTPVPPPVSQQSISNHQPVSNHQGMPHPAHAQQTMPTQGMTMPAPGTPQNMPQPGMVQQNMPAQGMPQQGMNHPHMPAQGLPQQTSQHPSMMAAQQPQGMPQQMPGQTMAPQGMPQHVTMQGMPEHNSMQQGMPHQGMHHPLQPSTAQHMTTQGMPEQNSVQQGMPPQGMPQHMTTSVQQGMPGRNSMQQEMPQHGMHPPVPSTTAQGMPQPNSVQPAAAQQSMPPQVQQTAAQHGISQQQPTALSHTSAYPEGRPSQAAMQRQQDAWAHEAQHPQQTSMPSASQAIPSAVATHPSQTPMAQQGQPAPTSPQQMTAQSQVAPMAPHQGMPSPMGQQAQNPFVPGSALSSIPQMSHAPVGSAPREVPMAQQPSTTEGYVPQVQPLSQAPVSDQPVYVHQDYAAAGAPASAQGFAAPAPVAQAFAPPAPVAAPAMPQFAPADEPVSEPPITATRLTQSPMNKKQPRSQELDDEPEITEEARLSEILPKAGTIEKSKPKRKGLFWRKKADDDDDQDDAGDDKDSWKVAASTKSKGKDDDDDLDSGDQWAVTPGKDADADLAEKDDDAAEEPDVWAPEATKKSEPRRDSLLNETEGPQRLARRTPQGPVTKGNNAAVTEDDWNLSPEATSDHDEEDEEEVG